MTIIYLLNSLVNGIRNTLCEMKHKFIFIKTRILSLLKKLITFLSKIKFYLYKKMK